VFIGAVLLTVATLHAAGNIPRPLVTTDNLSTDGTIAVETTEWKLVFDEHFNGGISQWYDLAHDPGQTDNLATDASGGYYGQGVLFDYDFYLGVGLSGGQEFMTTMGRNADPGSLELAIIENTPARVRILQRCHPRLNNGAGPPGDPFPELKWVTTTTLWTIYPTGRVAIDFTVDVNPDGLIVDSGPGGNGKGVSALGCCGYEKWLNASGGTDFLGAFAWSGDTIESASAGWGPIQVVSRPSPAQLILAQAVPAGTNLDYVIRRDQFRLETISIHADGDPSVSAQCSDPAISRWQGGSNGDPLWSVMPSNNPCRTRYRDNNPATGYPPIADDVILAHWTRDRGAGSGLVFYEPWEGVNGGYFNDEAFTDISYTQLGKVGIRQFSPHHRHFMAQLGSSSSTVLPTIKSVSDMIPAGQDYRSPYINVIVGQRAQGDEIASEGFNAGQGAYEIQAECNEVFIRFAPCGGQDRACLPYVAPVLVVSNFHADDSDVTVEISTDAGSTFSALANGSYNLTGSADQAETGYGRRIFQYLDTVPASATGNSRVAIRVATLSGACPVTTTTTTTTTTSTTTTLTSVCGNGVPEIGEECDDGGTANGDGCSAYCEIELAQTSAQQKCITGMNKAGSKVALTQGKINVGCVKYAGKVSDSDPAACVVADARGKLAKARVKTLKVVARSCTETPDFGFTDASTVNGAASSEELGLLEDVFGPDLNASLIVGTVDKRGAYCQAAAAKTYEKIVVAKLKAFNGCKKTGLKSGYINSRARLEECFDGIIADPGGRIAKAIGKLDKTMDSRCGDYLVDAFPGKCQGQAEFAQCVDTLVECRVCLMLNSADALNRNCDSFDDDVINDSCP